MIYVKEREKRTPAFFLRQKIFQTDSLPTHRLETLERFARLLTGAKWRLGGIDDHLAADPMPVRSSRRFRLKARRIHRMHADDGQDDDIVLRVAARVDGPDNFPVIKNVDVFVHGDGHLGMQDRTR